MSTMTLDSIPAYWAAVGDTLPDGSGGEIVLAYPANDGNGGEAARAECNQYINDAMLNDGVKLHLIPLYTQAHLRREVKVPEGCVVVTAEDANSYCRILTILGMEEEGDPIAWVESRKSLENGRSDGWMAESRADGYVIISPSGDSTFVQDSSMRISDEILRQLAQDLLSAAAPTTTATDGQGGEVES